MALSRLNKKDVWIQELKPVAVVLVGLKLLIRSTLLAREFVVRTMLSDAFALGAVYKVTTMPSRQTCSVSE